MKLDGARLKRISALMQEAVQDGDIPGAVVAVGIGDETIFFEACGYAERTAEISRDMTEATLFDLASLTKVVATLPSILQLVDDGALRLSDPVRRFMPEFAQDPKFAVTIGHLLTHTSGLVSHRPYHALFSSREQILQAVKTEVLGSEPGVKVEYSDLGFILLAEIVREITGEPIDRYAARHVFDPLEMRDTMYHPDLANYPNIVATEHGKVGVVHDENANALGGVSGHAGLFSTAMDLARYVKMWLGYGESILSPAVRQLAVKCHTVGLDGNRGLGWVCRYDAYDHTGDLWPDTTVGHTGYTGTSLAFDPVTSLWLIILTNDVHYGRQKRAILRLRALLHNVVGSSLR